MSPDSGTNVSTADFTCFVVQEYQQKHVLYHTEAHLLKKTKVYTYEPVMIKHVSAKLC